MRNIDKLCGEAITELHLKHSDLTAKLGGCSQDPTTTQLDDKTKEKRKNIYKHLTSLNELIKSIIKYQKNAQECDI